MLIFITNLVNIYLQKNLCVIKFVYKKFPEVFDLQYPDYLLCTDFSFINLFNHPLSYFIHLLWGIFCYFLFVIFSSSTIFIFFFVFTQVRKEYRKFIRQHSWLPKCLRCSKPSSSAGSGSDTSGTGKERRTSFYGASNGNQSGPNSHSTDNSALTPHGTSVGTNNIVIPNNLNNVRPTALLQVLSRTDLNNASTTTTNHNRLLNMSQQGTAT